MIPLFNPRGPEIYQPGMPCNPRIPSAVEVLKKEIDELRKRLDSMGTPHVEASDFAQLPEKGEPGTVYLTLDDLKVYWWTNAGYTAISDIKTLESHIADESVHVSAADRDQWKTTDSKLETHLKDTSRHITEGERTKWNDVITKVATAQADILQTQTDLSLHVNDTVKHVTKDERDKWNGASADLKTHLANRSNPHGVTASQVGAYTKGETDEAIKAEADRAKAAEAAETERAKKAESANADAITAEADRAKAAEEALAESLKKVAEYMAGESILLATNLINGVQHYAKQIMRYDADMAAWGAEWEGDYTFVDGDGEVPDVYCRAYKDGVEAGYVKQTLAWDKDMNAWGAVWTASDYTPAADEAKDLYVKTTFTDGVQYYTKQTVVWDADMNDWGAVWDGTYILYRGKFMKKGK